MLDQERHPQASLIVNVLRSRVRQPALPVSHYLLEIKVQILKPFEVFLLGVTIRFTQVKRLLCGW
jgi:hypothetical protein